MDTSIRDTEGRAPLYLYYEHCYGPFVDREDARRLYEKYPRSESCFRGVDPTTFFRGVPSCLGVTAGGHEYDPVTGKLVKKKSKK